MEVEVEVEGMLTLTDGRLQAEQVEKRKEMEDWKANGHGIYYRERRDVSGSLFTASRGVRVRVRVGSRRDAGQ